MSTLKMLHQSAIDAREEYAALVLAEAKGEAEERDAQGVRELLAIVGKTAADLERDIASAKMRYSAAKDFERVKQLRAEVAKLQKDKPRLQVEYNRATVEADAMIRRAKAPLMELLSREERASNEAINLHSRASEAMRFTGSNAVAKAAAFQRQINEVRGSVAFERNMLGGAAAKDAKETVDELTPKIERLERLVKINGPAIYRDELAQARQKFAAAQATLDHIESLEPIVAAADKRAAELEVEKQAGLDTFPAWDEIDFFADVPTEEFQRFGRPVIA